MPAAEWPDPVQRAFKHVNNPMQGPSELGASGKLRNWDRTADLPKITVPTLMIGAEYDTMDPELMKRMAGLVKRGRFLKVTQPSMPRHLADRPAPGSGPPHTGRKFRNAYQLLFRVRSTTDSSLTTQ